MHFSMRTAIRLFALVLIVSQLVLAADDGFHRKYESAAWYGTEYRSYDLILAGDSSGIRGQRSVWAEAKSLSHTEIRSRWTKQNLERPPWMRLRRKWTEDFESICFAARGRRRAESKSSGNPC
jgi:hypothetical protein